MIKKHWPILFLFLFWFSFSFPFFFLNKVPYPSTHQVNAFSPWNRYSQYASPIKNDAMPDLIDQIYPWKHFTIEQLKKGSLPLWNPYGFSGTPHMANFQSAVFSPFNVLYFLFSFVDAWSLIVLLQPLLAGVFTYIYMRKISISVVGSLIASITFMFSGFMVVWMAYGTLGMAITFLPLILYCIETFFEKKAILPLVGMSLALATSFLSGHFQTSLYVLGVSVLYLIWKVFLTKNKFLGWWAGFYLMLGLLLTMPQLIPSLEFYQYAPRSSSFTGSSGIPFYNLVTIVAPDFFGNPVTRNNLFMDYAEWQAFIGITPLLLSFFAFSFFRKKTIAHFFIITGVFALILSIASPLQGVIGSLHIPVISTSTQSRIISIFAFSFAVLAGFGVDSLQKYIQEKRYKSILLRIVLGWVIFGSIWGVLFFGNFLSAEHTKIAVKNFILPTVFLFTMSGLLILMLYSKKRYFIYCFLIGVIGLTAFDSFRFATKWMPFDPKYLVFPEEKIISRVRKEAGNGRVYGNIGQEMTMFYKLPTIGGYDPLYIQRYGEFIASAPTGSFTHSGGRTVFLDKTTNNADKVLNTLGVKTIIHPVGDTNAVWAFPVWKKKHMLPVYSDGVYTLYRNTTALPRAKMFYDYTFNPEKEKIIQQFYLPTFDYKNTLLLEEKSPIVKTTNTNNTISFISDNPNIIELSVDTNQSGMLFLSDSYYPGWNAYIDGEKTPIFRANYAFRAIVVPQGKHTVRFMYQPMSFYTGTMIAFFAIIGLTTFVFIPKRFKRQAKIVTMDW